MHPIPTVLGHELVVSFDRETHGWRNDEGAGQPYSWTTALGLLAVSLLSADISASQVAVDDWIGRAKDLAAEADPYEYDVGISFGGPQRDVAKRIYDRLTQAGLRVFYDKAHPDELLGEDLAELFQQTYYAKSRYAVAIVSQAFLDSTWANNWERKAITARMVETSGAYLLPYQWEPGVKIPGVNPTIGHISRADATPEEFAEFVIRKVLASRSED
jgi:hypothetical protein